MTTVLVTGGHGQLGRSVVRRGRKRGLTIAALGVDMLDITDEARITACLAETMPAFVINAAAYTSVDKAESERERVFSINAIGAGNVARACAAREIPLFHVSSDYVFDGTAVAPYREDDPPHPLSVYGASKAAGEALVHAAGGIVVRTSWLFGAGGPSFVQRMLQLATNQTILRVVGDQYGCPTWADDLADALLELGRRSASEPTYHFCNDGPTTWHAFASAIIDEARRHRVLACGRVDAITTREYPTLAQRPAFSVLDTSRVRALGIEPTSWTIGLAHVVAVDLRRVP